MTPDPTTRPCRHNPFVARSLLLVPSRVAAGIRVAGGPARLLRHVRWGDVWPQTLMLAAAVVILAVSPRPMLAPGWLVLAPLVYLRAVLQVAINVAEARQRVLRPRTTGEWREEVGG